jgi:hypothetical protein
VVSAIQSRTTDKFSNTSLYNPIVLARPEFGSLSDLLDADVAGRLYAIQDSINILLNMSGLDMWFG